MTVNPRIKVSSRAGRFKQKLVPEDRLLEEAPLFMARMAPVVRLFEQKLISEAEFTALSLLAGLSLREPGNWLGARAPSLTLAHKLEFKLQQLPWQLEKNICQRLEAVSTLGDLFNNFALKSTPRTVNRSLLQWSTGHYPLRLYFDIPSPRVVLDQQKRGERCVSVLTEASRLSKYVLGERDHLSFTMHDLIHADHFFHDNQSFRGQLGFYGLLDFCLTEQHFQQQLKQEKFAQELDYLISDMNAYAIHLMKCLKAALIHYHPAPEQFFRPWVGLISGTPEEAQALLLLNTPDYRPPEHDSIILLMLERYQYSEGTIRRDTFHES